MDKTVIELFAGVGGFRVGLNNIKGFDKDYWGKRMVGVCLLEVGAIWGCFFL